MKIEAIIVLIIGVIILALPDPSSISDFLALAVVITGLNMAGAKISLEKLLK